MVRRMDIAARKQTEEEVRSKMEEDNLAEMVGCKLAGQRELKDIEVERPDIEEPNIIIINSYYLYNIIKE